MNTNILDYGAVSGSDTVCTNAIQEAIDACAKSGGGRVTIPAGSYVSGTIWLKSHVELHLEHGATLIASKNRDDYNAENAYEQNYSCPPEEWVGQHFIVAVEQEDVAITGNGTIDGSGDAFFEDNVIYGAAYWMHGVSLAKDKEKLRPGQMVCFIECTNVTVENITMCNTPCWACFFHGCEIVSTRGVKIFNPPRFCNTDGLDIDSCRYVTVSDCIILTGDDAIAIRNASHRLKNKERSCEYITITNCVLSTCACGVRIGVGKGIIRHVRISNLTVQEAGALFYLMSGYLGSGHIQIEDVHIAHVSATNVSIPFEVQDSSEAGISHVSFEDIYVEAVYPSNLNAPKAGTISDIAFQNIDIQMKLANPNGEPHIAEDGAIIKCNGVQELLLERVQIRGEENVLSRWPADVKFVDCTDVETYRCKYREM